MVNRRVFIGQVCWFYMTSQGELLVNIISLKGQKLKDSEIAELMGIDELLVNTLYDTAGSIFSNSNSSNLEQIAQETGLDHVQAFIASNHYSSHQRVTRKRSVRERREQQIAELHKQGLGLDEIRERTGLTEGTLRGSYRLTTGKSKPREEREKEIKEYQEQGLNFDEIRERTGLTEKRLNQYGVNRGKNKTPQERVNQIKGLLDKNRYECLEDLAQEIGILTRTIIGNYSSALSEQGYKLPPVQDFEKFYRGVKKDPKKDRLIKRGLSLEQISKKTRISKERVRQYIVGRGMHEEWRESREHFKNQTHYKFRDNKRDQILADSLDGLIKSKLDELPEKERFASEGAMIIDSNRTRGRSYSFEQVYDLLVDRFEVIESGGKKSVSEYERDHDISFPTVSRIFQRLNLSTTHDKKHKAKKFVNDFQEEAIERAYDLCMNVPDIAYFLGVRPHVVSVRFIEMGGRDPGDYVKELGGVEGKKKVNYRIASQVYEARDAGFSIDETLELLDTSRPVYDFAIRKSKTIKPDIIEALKVLYPDRNIENPWVDFDR